MKFKFAYNNSEVLDIINEDIKTFITRKLWVVSGIKNVSYRIVM
jgi:hypothetical protein